MKAKTTIGLHHVKINTIDGNSTVSIGKKNEHGNHVVNHRNEGFGEQNADEVTQIMPASTVEDSDFTDAENIKK